MKVTESIWWPATQRPRILDLYCCAGGAARGYHDAGFEVVGVDIVASPRYPYQILQRDALTLDPEWIRRRFHAIHASPPCQSYSALKLFAGEHHLQLIDPTRELLEATGLPYVIENVEGARDFLHDPKMLCGSMFGKYVRRHRLFETNWGFTSEMSCRHKWQSMTSPGFSVQHSGRKGRNGKLDQPARAKMSPIIGVYGGGRGGGMKGQAEARRREMGIDWMQSKELNEAIPPYYTEYIGRQLIEVLK